MFKKGQIPWNKIFTKKQEQQIYKEYFSKEKPSTYTLAKKHGCNSLTIGNTIKRNGGTLRNLSKSHKGQKAWNKGLTKNTDKRVKKISKVMKIKVWSKGLTKGTDKRLLQLSKKLKGRKAWNKGLTKEIDMRMKKISEINEGENNPMYGKHHSPEVIQKISKNGYGIKCRYKGESFPSLFERDGFIKLIKFGFEVEHNFLGRFDAKAKKRDFEAIMEFHMFYKGKDREGRTEKQYYNQRRKLLNKYGYKNLKLVVIKDLKEIETIKRL